MFSRKKSRSKQSGIALIITMIFIVIFSTLSVAMFTMSSSNTIVANNLRQVNEARSAAESGLEVLRYYMGKIAIPGSVSKSGRFAQVVSDFMGSSSVLPSGFSCSLNDDGALVFGSSGSLIALDGSDGFFATMTPDGTNGVNIRITGTSGQINRTITSGFTYGTRDDSVFDFGVATKGPLELDGGTLTSVTVRSESDVYIESLNDPEALGVLKKKSEISGVAKIVNANATIDASDIVGKVGGLSGQDAIDNSIEVGVTPTEFPYPDAQHFEQYATGGYYTNGTTLENKIIKAGTNPKFTGGTIITGILYIESPNTVEFGGNVTVKGMIVCEGSWTDNSGANKLAFTGSVDSYALPADSKFDALRGEKGTFVMAPGFDVSFWGSFGTVNGAIAGNGIKFGGNAGGTVKGSVINYSDTKMTVVGSSDIVFNRSGITEIPAGFVQEVFIHYNPTAYEEVL